MCHCELQTHPVFGVVLVSAVAGRAHQLQLCQSFICITGRLILCRIVTGLHAIITCHGEPETTVSRLSTYL